MTHQALLAELERLNVKISLAGDKLRLDAPAGVLTPELKKAVTKHKPELLAWLRNPTCEVWPGNVVRVYPMRKSCLEAGHCLSLTRERDCGLFPVRPGWCRERVSIRRQAHALR